MHAGLTVAPIKSHGTPEQQARLLPPLASGEQRNAAAVPTFVAVRWSVSGALFDTYSIILSMIPIALASRTRCRRIHRM